MRSIGAHLRFVLAVLGLLLVAVAPTRSHYFCKMMGRAVAECCCAGRDAAHDSAGPTLRAPDCCERLVPASQPVWLAQRDAAPSLFTAPFALTPALLEPPPPAYRLLAVTPPGARAPPSLGPPLFIVHCSLLI
jgi:hypothetical protein